MSWVPRVWGEPAPSSRHLLLRWCKRVFVVACLVSKLLFSPVKLSTIVYALAFGCRVPPAGGFVDQRHRAIYSPPRPFRAEPLISTDRQLDGRNLNEAADKKQALVAADLAAKA